MIEFLNNLDTSTFLALNGLHSPFFDNFMLLFTGRYIWIPMYLMVLWILFRSYRPKVAFILLGCLGAAIFLTDQTCATLIRPIVERMRPSNIENPLSEFTYIVDGYRGGPFGFPSCHAANSFALIVFTALVVRHRSFTIFIVAWGIVNSLSRIYLGVHYPGDLLVGGAIGSFYGWLLYRIGSRLTARIPTRESRHNSVNLRQLTSGIARPLESLTPVGKYKPIFADVLNSIAVPAASLTSAYLMMATFAITLLTIILLSLV